MKISHRFSVLTAAATFAFGLTTFVLPSIANAAPSAMSCPQLTTNQIGTCTFRANPNEVVWVTSSNTAIAVGSPGSLPGFGTTGVTIQADASGNGRVAIRSFNQKGQVTICAFDITRAFRSCSITRVN